LIFLAGAAFAGAAGAFSSAFAAEAAALATGAAGAAAVGGDVLVGGDAAGAVGCANATEEMANKAASVNAVFMKYPL
jgi:hypothetical protein